MYAEISSPYFDANEFLALDVHIGRGDAAVFYVDLACRTVRIAGYDLESGGGKFVVDIELELTAVGVQFDTFDLL